MCKLGFLAFEEAVPQELRKEAVAKLARNSWNMGNHDGVGYVTWNAGSPAVVSRSLELKELAAVEIGRFALVHARAATTGKGIENCHPFENDGAWLVHNGMVSVSPPNDDVVKKACKSTCDSELILASYLQSERNLVEALDVIRGMANVMLYDEKREVLSLFPDNSPFLVWRQNGVFLIVQHSDQTAGIVHSGLGSPYEYDTLPQNKVYEISLKVAEIAWDELMQSVALSARPQWVKSAWQQHNRDRPYASDYGMGESVTEGGVTYYGRNAAALAVHAKAIRARNGERSDTVVVTPPPAPIHLSRKERKRLARLAGTSGGLSSDMRALADELDRFYPHGAERLSDKEYRDLLGNLTQDELVALRRQARDNRYGDDARNPQAGYG